MKPNEWVELLGQRYHTADAKGRPYVRLTFMPAGAKRRRTTWAVKTGKRSYVVVSSDGDDMRDGGKRDGKEVDLMEVILVGPTDKVVEKPAGYSFKYGELVLLPKETAKK